MQTYRHSLWEYSKRFHCSFEGHLTPHICHMTLSIETYIRRTPFIKRTIQNSPGVSAFSSGKKINCILLNAYTDIFRTAQTSYYPFSPIPMGFVPCDARVLASLRCLRDSTLDLFKRSLFTFTKDNNISEAGSLEITAFVYSSINVAEK